MEVMPYDDLSEKNLNAEDKLLLINLKIIVLTEIQEILKNTSDNAQPHYDNLDGAVIDKGSIKKITQFEKHKQKDTDNEISFAKEYYFIGISNAAFDNKGNYLNNNEKITLHDPTRVSPAAIKEQRKINRDLSEQEAIVIDAVLSVVSNKILKSLTQEKPDLNDPDIEEITNKNKFFMKKIINYLTDTLFQQSIFSQLGNTPIVSAKFIDNLKHEIRTVTAAISKLSQDETRELESKMKMGKFCDKINTIATSPNIEKNHLKEMTDINNQIQKIMQDSKIDLNGKYSQILGILENANIKYYNSKKPLISTANEDDMQTRYTKPLNTETGKHHYGRMIALLLQEFYRSDECKNVDRKQNYVNEIKIPTNDSNYLLFSSGEIKKDKKHENKSSL